MRSPLAHINAQEFSVQDVITDRDFTKSDLDLIFNLATHLKASPRSYVHALEGRQLALLFEKPSLRTRATFEVAMTSLGGHAIYLDHARPRLGEREAIKDIARNLERWVDGIAARTFAHSAVIELCRERFHSGYQCAHGSGASLPGTRGLLYVMRTIRPRAGAQTGVCR